MKGRGERKKKEGRKARKRVPSPSRCCSLPLPQVRPSLSARTHARQIFYNRKKKEGEREEQSRCEHTTRTHAHNHSRRWATSTSRTSVRSPRSGVSRQLSPGKKKNNNNHNKSAGPPGKRRGGAVPAVVVVVAAIWFCSSGARGELSASPFLL